MMDGTPDFSKKKTYHVTLYVVLSKKPFHGVSRTSSILMEWKTSFSLITS